MALLEQDVWTRWLPAVPSNLNYLEILWSWHIWNNSHPLLISFRLESQNRESMVNFHCRSPHGTLSAPCTWWMWNYLTNEGGETEYNEVSSMLVFNCYTLGLIPFWLNCPLWILITVQEHGLVCSRTKQLKSLDKHVGYSALYWGLLHSALQTKQTIHSHTNFSDI